MKRQLVLQIWYFDANRPKSTKHWIPLRVRRKLDPFSSVTRPDASYGWASRQACDWILINKGPSSYLASLARNASLQHANRLTHRTAEFHHCRDRFWAFSLGIIDDQLFCRYIF